MKRIHLLFLLFLLSSIGFLRAQGTYLLDSTTLSSRTIITGIDIPWEIIWGPDNQIWATERYGRVSKIDTGTGVQTVLLDLSAQVYSQSEAGLLGMFLHPDFSNQPYVYLAYTYQSGPSILERIVRYRYNGTILETPQILIDNIAGNTTHIGARFLMLPDSTLLISTGDAQNQNLPQNVNSKSGKILRINLDGTIPADNPFPNNPVWTWGHRNAQGLCLAPNGHIYCSEHGPTTDDELHILRKGRNYGWPTVHGFCDSPPEQQFCLDSNVVEPLVAWTPTIAPSDLLWYTHPSIPEFQNKLLMAVLKDKKLISFGFNASGDTVISQRHYLTNQFGRIRDICVSPDGRLYIATNGSSWSNTNPFTHSIIELRNANYNPTPTAITAITSVKSYQFSPNPIREGAEILVKLPSDLAANCILSDLYGRILWSANLEDATVCPVQLPKGLYIIRLEESDGNLHLGKLQIW